MQVEPSPAARGPSIQNPVVPEKSEFDRKSRPGAPRSAPSAAGLAQTADVMAPASPTSIERAALIGAGVGTASLGAAGGYALGLGGYGLLTLGALIAAVGGGSGVMAVGIGLMVGSTLPVVGGIVLAANLIRAGLTHGDKS